MADIKDLDKKLDLYRESGISALGQYAITCLIYADKNEQLEGKKRFCFGPDSASANEHLLFRIIDELVEHGFIEESFEIIPLMHRAEYSISAWSLPMRYIIKNNQQSHYKKQFTTMIVSFPEPNLIDTLTLADLSAGFMEYQKSVHWLERAFAKLQNDHPDSYQWERFGTILSSCPANEVALNLALRVWEKVKDDRSMAKYYVGAFLTLFEGRSEVVDAILKNLSKHPIMGASVSVNDLAMRNSAGLWLKLDNPQRAVQAIERIVDQDYKQYAQNDLLMHVKKLVEEGFQDKADTLLRAMGKSMAWYLPKIESEKTKSEFEENRTTLTSELASLAKSQLEQAAIVGKRRNISKVEASEQIQILKRLLEINQLAEAWKVVDLLVETLEKVPAFRKHEYRAGDVSKLLEPYRSSHPQILYKFTAELIRRDAKKDYWQAVQGISATLSLIVVLGGAKPLIELAQFLSNWPNGEIDN